MKIDSSSGLFGRVLIGELMLRAINATLAASYSSTLWKDQIMWSLFKVQQTLFLIANLLVPGLHNLWQPCSRAAIKWRENEKMKRKWKESEEMERVVRACLVPIFFDNKSYWHHTNWYLQPAGTNIAVFSTLLPLPFAQNKREEEYSLYVLRYKSICPNSKAAGLVQCAAPQQDAMSWLLPLLTLPQRFSSFFAILL